MLNKIFVIVFFPNFNIIWVSCNVAILDNNMLVDVKDSAFDVKIAHLHGILEICISIFFDKKDNCGHFSYVLASVVVGHRQFVFYFCKLDRLREHDSYIPY